MFTVSSVYTLYVSWNQGPPRAAWPIALLGLLEFTWPNDLSRSLSLSLFFFFKVKSVVIDDFTAKNKTTGLGISLKINNSRFNPLTIHSWFPSCFLRHGPFQCSFKPPYYLFFFFCKQEVPVLLTEDNISFLKNHLPQRLLK